MKNQHQLRAKTLTLTHLHIYELGLSRDRAEYLREDAIGCFCVAMLGDLMLVDTRDFATALTDSEREVLESIEQMPDYIELSEQ